MGLLCSSDGGRLRAEGWGAPAAPAKPWCRSRSPSPASCPGQTCSRERQLIQGSVMLVSLSEWTFLRADLQVSVSPFSQNAVICAAIATGPREGHTQDDGTRVRRGADTPAARPAPCAPRPGQQNLLLLRQQSARYTRSFPATTPEAQHRKRESRDKLALLPSARERAASCCSRLFLKRHPHEQPPPPQGLVVSEKKPPPVTPLNPHFLLPAAEHSGDPSGPSAGSLPHASPGETGQAPPVWLQVTVTAA